MVRSQLEYANSFGWNHVKDDIVDAASSKVFRKCFASRDQSVLLVAGLLRSLSRPLR